MHTNSQAVAPVLRERLRALDSGLLVSNLRPIDAVISGALSRPGVHLVLVSSFALLALTLAAVGIHAIVGYPVVQRTREVGIRMAAESSTLRGLPGSWRQHSSESCA